MVADFGAFIRNGDLAFLLAAQETGRVTQKKWLADVAANHLSGQPARPVKNSARLKCPWCSGSERSAGTAISRSVGILKNEALAHQCFFVLERRAVQIQKALGVDE